MNLRHASLLSALLLGVAASAIAQAPSTTGTVMALSRETGHVTVLPGSSQRPLYFRDMKRARYLYGSGRRASFDNLRAGQVVTVEYLHRGNAWYVGRVILPNPTDRPYPQMPPGGLVTAERRATTSRAANDRDITTHPGTKARIDGDITTQPGRTDPYTNTDITKRPDNR